MRGLIKVTVALLLGSAISSCAPTAPPLKPAIRALAAPQVTLVAGTAMTYTDGTYTWAGNRFCVGEGYNYTLQPGSPAIDAADKGCTHIDTWTLQCQTGPDDTPPNSTITVSTISCPQPGSALNQPRLPDPFDSYCSEWYGKAPDIGACEFVPASTVPNAPASTNIE